MRDPSRIEEILFLLKKYWESNPDLRLGQILENMASLSNQRTFYMEDNLVIKFLKERTEKE
jgi:uncharacterized protein YihD (DUF1040 family)